MPGHGLRRSQACSLHVKEGELKMQSGKPLNLLPTHSSFPEDNCPPVIISQGCQPSSLWQWEISVFIKKANSAEDAFGIKSYSSISSPLKGVIVITTP